LPKHFLHNSSQKRFLFGYWLLLPYQDAICVNQCHFLGLGWLRVWNFVTKSEPKLMLYEAMTPHLSLLNKFIFFKWVQ
jgi:hypothetical protein